MIDRARAVVGTLLRYRPLPASAVAREAVESYRFEGRPFCPPWEGDLLFTLAARSGRSRCLQIGFGTGSTAAYMLCALGEDPEALVTSIDWSPTEFNSIGLDLLRRAGLGSRHNLIAENSLAALPRLLEQGERYGVIFVDGWKTFDHLAAEAWFVMRLLDDGGFLMFDDTHMDSVRRVISMLQSHYLVEEIAYREFDQTPSLRGFQILSGRTLRRPYRAFVKARTIESLRLTHDWNFYERF